MKAQELQDKISNSINLLAAATDEAAQSEAFQNWLATFNKFHTYSFRNQFLIALQRPDATRVAGYHKWIELKRFVRKGERGIGILAPIISKDKDTGTDVCRGFTGATVFDVSQTDGEPLPTIDWQASEINAELQSKLIKFADSKGIKVSTNLTGAALGVSYGGSINLQANAGTSVLIHELAHEILHRGAERAELTREQKELEAETTAFVVSQYFGLDTIKSAANYLASWHGESKSIVERMTRIAKAASEIITAVE